MFDTFHGDEVTHAKLRQRAAELKVHPEESGSCADIYTASMVVAGLATLDGDKVAHVPASDAVLPPARSPLAEEEPSDGLDDPGAGDEPSEEEITIETPGRRRAVFNVNVTLDSSLDTEKLERQLRLLKKFGAI